MTHLICRILAEARWQAMSDADLLAEFRERREEGAFAALLHRHGPMIMGVRRNALKNGADAEDAFQATFLVFARRAAAIRKSTSLFNWLHGVGRRAAIVLNLNGSQNDQDREAVKSFHETLRKAIE